jgi:hypothetical protein
MYESMAKGDAMMTDCAMTCRQCAMLCGQMATVKAA